MTTVPPTTAPTTTHSTPAPTKEPTAAFNEPQKRIEIVGIVQRKVEFAVAKAKKAAAVFFVPTMLTPLYLNPDDVFLDNKDGLYKLKNFNPDDIVCVGEDANKKKTYQLAPGVASTSMAAFLGELMPLEKAKDPAQLSTVLGRVISMHEMLEAGVPVAILTTNMGRPKLNNPDALVEVLPGSVLARHDNRITRVVISDGLYKLLKDKIAAATYKLLNENGAERTVNIFASQINAANSTTKFDRLFSDIKMTEDGKIEPAKIDETKPYVQTLEWLLKKMSTRSLNKMFEEAAPDLPAPKKGPKPTRTPKA